MAATKLMTVRELIAKLQTCHLDADVWVTTSGDEEMDPDKMSLVVGVEFSDCDDDASREVGRKRYGVPYLREPVLLVEPNV